MKLLRIIRKWLRELLGPGLDWSGGIDSHKWESKIEILGHFSGGWREDLFAGCNRPLRTAH